MKSYFKKINQALSFRKENSLYDPQSYSIEVKRNVWGNLDVKFFGLDWEVRFIDKDCGNYEDFWFIDVGGMEPIEGDLTYYFINLYKKNHKFEAEISIPLI